MNKCDFQNYGAINSECQQKTSTSNPGKVETALEEIDIEFIEKDEPKRAKECQMSDEHIINDFDEYKKGPRSEKKIIEKNSNEIVGTFEVHRWEKHNENGEEYEITKRENEYMNKSQQEKTYEINGEEIKRKLKINEKTNYIEKCMNVPSYSGRKRYPSFYRKSVRKDSRD